MAACKALEGSWHAQGRMHLELTVDMAAKTKNIIFVAIL